MINLGLKRITRLLQHIARQQLKQEEFNPPWKAIHITGTNGKGSVAAYLSALLRRNLVHENGSRIRVGRFTSPHFIDRWDCITIDDQAVSKDLFERTENQIKRLSVQVARELQDEDTHLKIASREEQKKTTELTEFEILTATAFTIFSEPLPKPCDIAIIECGLGGRLDATNALPDSAIGVSIITRIGLDHLDMLGGSLRSIVTEKCGIFRSNVPVVVDGDNGEDVLKMISEEIMQKLGEEHLDCLNYTAKGKDLERTITNAESEQHSKKYQAGLEFPRLQKLLPHQRANLAMALTVLRVISEDLADRHATPIVRDATFENHDFDSAASLEEALSDAAKSYPARLQLFEPGWLAETPDHNLPQLNQTALLLDGAHNAQSAEVLRQFIARELTQQQQPELHRPCIYILALSSTKPPVEILSALFPAVAGSLPKERPPINAKIVFTSFGPVDNMPWVKPAKTSDLSSAAASLGLSHHVLANTSNIVEALRVVEKELTSIPHGEQPFVVVAGSLYLASDFLRVLRDGRGDFERYWKDTHAQ